MARIYKERQPQRGRDDYWPEDTGSEGGYQRPGGTTSEHVDKTLGSIDDALASSEKLAASGTPSSDKKPLSPTEVGEAESSSAGGLYSGASDAGSIVKKVVMSRRKKAAIGVGVGGVGGIIATFFMLSQPFKIPSIMGGLQNDIGSSRIARNIIEKRFDRVVTKYLIAKKAGNLDTIARPGSALDKLYKVFDKVNLESIIERQNGIKFAEVGGEIRVFHNGKDMGKASTYEEYKARQKGNRQFARDAKGIYTRTLPIMRFSMSTTIFRYMRQWIPRFGTPEYDKDKTEQENLAELERQQIDLTLEGPMRVLGDGIDCLSKPGASEACATFEEDRQPVDTSDPSLSRQLSSSGAPQDKSAEAVEDTANQSFNEAREQGPKNGSFVDRLLEKLLQKIVSAATAKTVVLAIPAFGQIDTLAVIQHGIGEAFSKKIGLKAGVIIKEYIYGSIGAMWLGYGDEVKTGKMNPVFAAQLSNRLTGHNLSATHKYLYGGDPAKGTQVDPKVGSNLDDPMAGALDAIYGCPLSPVCAIRLPLEIWYNTVTRVLDKIGEVGVGILGFIMKFSGFTALAEVTLQKIFGPEWQTELAKFAATAILKLFGIIIDPLASGAPLFNNIYTGVDVILNRYIQTNLGGRELTDRESTFALKASNEHYRQNVASLPLYDRLFSLDLSSSLASKLIIAAPSDARPSTIASSIIDPIKMLPATFMNLFSGQSWAAVTPQGGASVNGVSQFGGSVAEIDADIAAEVATQEIADIKDVQCPPNAEGFFNNCQAYKETITVGMCIHTNCPQLQN